MDEKWFNQFTEQTRKEGPKEPEISVILSLPLDYPLDCGWWLVLLEK